MTQSLYTRPALGANELFYSDNRFWVVKMIDEAGFEYYNKGDYDLVVWDCEEGYALGVVNILKDGKFQCFSIAPMDVGKPVFDDIRACVKWLYDILDEVAQ